MGAVAVIALGTAGCGATTPRPASANRHTIVLLLGARAQRSEARIASGARHEARRIGSTLRVVGSATRTPGAQIRLVDAVIASKPAAVVIVPVDREALTVPIESMKQAGIKVVQILGTDAFRSGRSRQPAAAGPYQEGVDGVQQAVNAIEGKPARPILTMATWAVDGTDAERSIC